MNEVQKMQLALLIKLDEVCKKCGLRYYLAYGTCLGAARHKGFIPWDHDIDVLMPADDAFKLEQYQKEFEPEYCVESYRTNSFFTTTCMRLVDRKHRVRIVTDNKAVIKDNIAMDIYLLYHCPKGRFALLLNIWRSHLYKMLVGGVPQNHGVAAKILGKIILRIFGCFNKERLIKGIETKLNYKGESADMADYYGQDISFCHVIRYKKEWFADPTKMQFEGYVFDGPTNPHEYLKRRYGNYMILPSRAAIDHEPHLELLQEG